MGGRGGRLGPGGPPKKTRSAKSQLKGLQHALKKIREQVKPCLCSRHDSLFCDYGVARAASVPGGGSGA
jgi:hypothetical protein